MAVVGIAALATFALYTVTACRAVYFGDAGELVTAAAGLGVAHPPGYPLWTVLAKGALLVPIGEAAFRVALLSAAFGAAASALTAWWVLRATGSAAAALAAAGLLSVSSVVWGAATVPEVYTLHLVLVLAFLEAARRVGASVADDRSARITMLGGAAILGAGLAHHPTIVLAIPSAAVLAWPGRKRCPPSILAAATLIAIGVPAVAYGSLLPRAAANPEASWGTLRTVRDLVAHVTALQYRSYDLGWAGLLRPDAWRSIAVTLIGGTGLVGLLAAAWAVILGIRNRRAAANRETVALALLGLGSCLFALRYGVEDVDAYLIPAVAAISILAGYGLQAISSRARLMAALAGLLVVAVPLIRNFPERDLRTVSAAADYGRDILDTLPRGAILIADGDDAFVLAYLQRVLGERPDVAIFDRDGFVLRDVVDEVAAAVPARETAAETRGRLLHRVVVDAMLGSNPRDVFFMSLPVLPLPAAIRLDVYGILFRASRVDRPPEDDRELWTRYRESRIVEQSRRVGAPFSDAVAASYSLMRAEAALARGDRARAESETEAAIARAPRSESVRNTAGTIYGRLELYDAAIREFEAALAVKPSSARARANLGSARRLRGR